MRVSPNSTMRAGLLATALFLAGCNQDVDGRLARTWCGFDGEAEAPFLRAQGFRVAPGIADEDAAGEALEAIAPRLTFVDSTIETIRFHGDGTLEVTERSGEHWESTYSFVSPDEIAFTDPAGAEVRAGVVVDGNTLALVSVDDRAGHEVHRFVRALPFIPC